MMSCGLSKSLGLSSSLKMQQGIVTILGASECDISSNILSAPSLRRTFSADLSTKNGFSPMKRISSSEKLTAVDANNKKESKSGFDIWAQIQENNNKNGPEQAQSDVWSSILSDKKKAGSSNDVVYVHPLMKRASSLSEKSLEICTESLGSETGSEVFSSVEKEISLVLNVTETKVEAETELPRASFPPPIRSLTNQSGTSLHMKTRRDNGRLVLEAVSMPSHNNFSAKRQDGRLLLTVEEINNEPNNDIASDEEDETDSEWFSEEEEEEQEDFAYKPNGLIFKMEEKPISPIFIHRLAPHKPIGVPKRNEPDTKSDMLTPVVHSLPPRPRVAQLARLTKPPSTVDDTVGAACFNTCDYFWKPTNIETLRPNTKKPLHSQNVVNKSVDGWSGCKERRRSLLSVENFCIAT